MNSLTVTEIIARSIENGCKEMLRKGIRMCAEKYGFSAEEALSYLEVDEIKLKRKVMRRSKGKKSKVREIPMPFSREMVNGECCTGLRYNGGLYTQCEGKRGEEGYCNSCLKEGIENGTGVPDNGNLEGRLKVDLMEYKDPKGRSPKEYLKILKKQNISEEEAKAEAGKKNYIIDNKHFEKKENKTKKEVVVGVELKKGRPKKEKKEIVSVTQTKKEEVKDLFAELLEETIEKDVKEKVVKKVEFVEEVIKKEEKKVVKKSEEEKAQEKEEKKAKLLAEKAAKEAAKEAEKAAKEAAKKAAKEEEKKNKKVKAKAEEVVVEEPKEEVEERKKVTVTRFEFEGKKYLKSSENILYDPETIDEMGIWCEESKSIQELPEEEDDDEEMEEEDYE
jgi:hypothetical protein